MDGTASLSDFLDIITKSIIPRHLIIIRCENNDIKELKKNLMSELQQEQLMKIKILEKSQDTYLSIENIPFGIKIACFANETTEKPFGKGYDLPSLHRTIKKYETVYRPIRMKSNIKKYKTCRSKGFRKTKKSMKINEQPLSFYQGDKMISQLNKNSN